MCSIGSNSIELGAVRYNLLSGSSFLFFSKSDIRLLIISDLSTIISKSPHALALAQFPDINYINYITIADLLVAHTTVSLLPKVPLVKSVLTCSQWYWCLWRRIVWGDLQLLTQRFQFRMAREVVLLSSQYSEACRLIMQQIILKLNWRLRKISLLVIKQQQYWNHMDLTSFRRRSL